MPNGISIIIPTQKTTYSYTQSHPKIPIEILIQTEPGVAYARNQGARRARYDLLMYMDDDVIIPPYMWSIMFHITKNQFAMAHSHLLPTTRALAIHRNAFWRVGGFDEHLKYRGEDRDFYIRACDHGLQCLHLNVNHITHIPHPQWPDRHRLKGWNRCKDHAYVMHKHWHTHPEFTARELYAGIRYLKPRTLLYELLSFLRYTIISTGKRYKIK